MKKENMHIWVLGLLMVVGVLILAPTEPAQAIPAFARKYRMSCTTCHAPIPRLKAYGDEFAGNGFVLQDQDAPRYFVETGDDELDLIREFPFAVRLEGFFKHQTVTGKEVDFTAPYNLKLLSGGALTKNVAYYFYFFFSERGEVAGIEDAYIMFNDLFKQDFDIYVGQFQVSDPLFKRELRLTYEDYMVYKSSIGNSGINLAYDRGVMMTLGLESGTDIIGEILNGNGIGEADEYRTYDNDKYKNFAGRISQDVGENLRIGAFGYYGKEASGGSTNEVTMLGGDLTVSVQDRFEANIQFLDRRDDNPLFSATAPEDKIKSQGGLIELIFMPKGDRSKVYGTCLYNRVDSRHNEDDYESITGHLGYLLTTNIRFIVENTYDIEYEENRFVVGFVSAF